MVHHAPVIVVQVSSHPSSDILQRLRASTADLHERVERKVNIFSAGFDLACYRRLLERFYGYWAPLEVRLTGVEGLDHPDLALLSRMKAHLLDADLRLLGTDPSLVSTCTQLPGVHTLARALGCMYVLEGSTLGAQFIARHIRETFQLDDGSGILL